MKLEQKRCPEDSDVGVVEDKILDVQISYFYVLINMLEKNDAGTTTLITSCVAYVYQIEVESIAFLAHFKTTTPKKYDGFLCTA